MSRFGIIGPEQADQDMLSPVKGGTKKETAVKVVNGPKWLEGIEWYYGQQFGTCLRSCADYDPRRDVDYTTVGLLLKLRTPLPEISLGDEADDGLYQVKHLLPIIQRTLRNLDYGWSGMAIKADRSQLIIWIEVPGQLQYFDRFLRSVVRKLQEGSQKSIKTKA